MRTAPISSSQTNLQNTIKVSQKMHPAMKINSSYTTMNMQKMQNPSFGWFGVDDLFYYYNRKLNKKREEERTSQINEVNRKVHGDSERIARKEGISVNEAWDRFNNSLKIGGIEINGKGKEVGLNKIVGYPLEKLTLIKDVVAPIVAEQIDKKKETEWHKGMTTPNGVVIYGSNGRGKTFLAQSLLDHFDYKKKNIKGLGDVGYLKIETTALYDEFSGYDNETDIGKIRRTFEGAKRFHAETGGHTIIFIDKLENLVNEEEHPELALEFMTQAGSAAENGITWVGTLVSPKKAPQWLFMPELTNVTMQLKEMDSPEKSAVMSYFWALHDRLDKTEHGEVIFGSEYSGNEVTAPMFSQISAKVNDALGELKDYKTPKRGEYRAPVETPIVVDYACKYRNYKNNKMTMKEIDKLNEDAEKYINDIKEEYIAYQES